MYINSTYKIYTVVTYVIGSTVFFFERKIDIGKKKP